MSNYNQNKVLKGSVEKGTVNLTQTRFMWHLTQDSLADIFKYEYGIKSSDFTSKVDNITMTWRLRLRLLEKDEKEYISATMKCTSDKNFKKSVNITVARDCKIMYSIQSDMRFFSDTWQHFVYIPKEKLFDQKINNNNCTIVCTIITSSEESALLSEFDCYHPFKKIINSKQFSDVTLRVEGKKLYAYKGILSSRSSVFSAMFSHNTRELNSSCVEISDIGYDTMYHLLEFMYTNSVPQFQCDEAQEKCKNLLIAADKYDLRKLKRKLTDNLISYIQVCNVFEFLSFADLYDSKVLKEKAIEFIISHKDEIIDSEAYKNFSSLHPDLSCEVFRSVLAKRRRLT